MRAIFLWAGLLAAQDLADQSRLAKQAMAQHRYAEAAAIYARLAAALPDNAGLRLNEGLALFSLGDFPAAAAAVEKATQLDPKLQTAWLVLGFSYQKQQQPALAIPPLLRAIELKPSDNLARFELSDAYLTTRQTGLAREQFEWLAARDPRNAKALLGLGVTYLDLYSDALFAGQLMEQQRWPEALARYRKALTASPSLPGAHASVARIYRATGHPDWAVIEAAMEKSPHPSYSERVDDVAKRLRQIGDSPELHEFLARLRETQGSRAEAAREWRKTATLAPRERRLQGPLARALWRNREYDDARPILEGLHREEPDSPEWNHLLGDLLYRQEQSEEALPLLEAAVRLDPGNLAAHAVLGRVYLQLGRAAEAVPHIEAALSTDEEDGALHYQLGIAYRRMGREDEARAVLDRQRVLSSSPPPSSAITPPEAGLRR